MAKLSVVYALAAAKGTRFDPVVPTLLHVLSLPLEQQVVLAGRWTLLEDLLFAGTGVLEF